MERHYRRIVKDTEERVAVALGRQIMDAENPRYGGFLDETGIVQAKYAIYQVADMVSTYCCQDAAFYRDGDIYGRIMAGLSYVRGVQHESGLFDYITCNFFSAPDTAFCIKKLLPIYGYLRGKEGKSDGEADICAKLEEIVRDGARGMLAGGFHTPNHRWAIASVLMVCARLFDSKAMEEAAFCYLKEGIDCNEDGEFSEKSAGNYNRVNNDAMIMLSYATGDASYEENAVRNLRMMLTYIEPDGSVFTANSTRFDKDRLMYPEEYYMEYLSMGLKYDIPEFLQMCNTLFDIVEEKRIAAPDALVWFLLYPRYKTFEYDERYQNRDYRVFYQESGIARCRRGRYTYTVMNGKSNFFYIHNGTMKLEVKVCGSFCEHRAFKSQEMERLGEGDYHLKQVMRGWYYLPFEQAPPTSDWWKMDNAARPRKSGPDMQVDVWVMEADNGVDIRVKTSGVEGAPWRIELAFSGVNFLTSPHLDMPLSGSEVLVVKDGDVEVSNGRDGLIVGPCFGAHHFTEGKEDSEAKTPGCATLYLADYTSFDHEIHIRNARNTPIVTG